MQSLRVLGTALVFAAFGIGLLSAWLWMRSTADWKDHLTRSYIAGAILYETLRSGAPPPAGIAVTRLTEPEQALAGAGDFARLADIPQPALITNVSIMADSSDRLSGALLTLAIISDDLRYRVAELTTHEGQTAPETLGALTRMLASYCSEPIVFARMGDAPWVRIDGTAVWGCGAAPRDLRLVAAIAGLVALFAFATVVLDTSARFADFAKKLRSRRRLGGPDSYETKGPEELREIVDAVNSYLETEREQLAKRAIVLSGISHDLGTPATRLRLRTALIEDSELREKLEADIDRMTGMIESVLTYTRAELNAETPRQLSLAALVEALVADYQDTGSPVEFRRAEPVVVQGGRSVFMSRQGHGTLPDERRVIVTARPVSLQRAVSNLIDNALKYGRRATVELETDADTATITVEDEGSDYSAEDVERLLAPFQRGDNTQSISGYGLGLTIVATVASLHGGALAFETGAKGLRARLTIQRR